MSFGILGVELAHGIRVCLNTLGKLLIVRADRSREGVDVGAFRGVLAGGRLRLLDLCPAMGDGGFVRPAPDLVEVAHGRTPVSHGAGGVGFGDLFKLALRFFVPEVVEQGDAAIEGTPDSGRAGDSKGDGAEALGRGICGWLGRMVHVHLGKRGQGCEESRGSAMIFMAVDYMSGKDDLRSLFPWLAAILLLGIHFVFGRAG